MSYLMFFNKVCMDTTGNHDEEFNIFWWDLAPFSVLLLLIGPPCDKICLRGFNQSQFQSSLLSYRDMLEN